MDDSKKLSRDLRDIKQMMERSSRFISLSGLSGISAGICALIGVFFARDAIEKNRSAVSDQEKVLVIPTQSYTEIFSTAL
jgi:hypothetical protein